MAQIKPNTLRKKILKQNKVLISYITNKGREIEAWGIKTIKGRVWKKTRRESSKSQKTWFTNSIIWKRGRRWRCDAIRYTNKDLTEAVKWKEAMYCLFQVSVTTTPGSVWTIAQWKRTFSGPTPTTWSVIAFYTSCFQTVKSHHNKPAQ